jgi:hypothetical protein
MPEVDFQAFETKFLKEFPVLKSNGTHIWSEKPCSHLAMHNLTMSIGGLNYHIPQELYTKEIS